MGPTRAMMNCLRGAGTVSRLAVVAAASALDDRAPAAAARSSGDLDSDYDYSVRVLGDQPEDEVYATYFGPGLLTSSSSERLLHFSHPPPWETIDDGSRRAGPRCGPGGVSMCSYPANLPTEDRACSCHAEIVADPVEYGSHAKESPTSGHDDKSQPLDVFAVFDGHGGYQVSDYASLNLVPYLLNSIRESDPTNPEVAGKYVNQETPDSVRVAFALKESFRRVERDIVSKLQPAF